MTNYKNPRIVLTELLLLGPSPARADDKETGFLHCSHKGADLSG